MDNRIKRAIHGSGLLVSGQVASQLFSFGRNILLARLLFPEDFGIAAMLMLVVYTLDMLSNLSVDRLLVQAADGNQSEFQDTAHSIQAIRGVGAACVILLISTPMAKFFDVPEAAWAFKTISLVPFIKGLAHLDRKRQHKDMRFGADVVSEVIPQGIAFVASIPFAWLFEGYSALVWLVILQTTTQTIITHVVAERQYRFHLNSEYVHRLTNFGWPLAINGLLISITMQGDKFIVGKLYSARELGIYSIAFSLTMLPAMSIARATSSVLLPLLSEQQKDLVHFDTLLRHTSAIVSCGACLFAMAFIALGPAIVLLLYGKAYSEAASVVGWLSVMHGVRLMRDVQSQAAMALGESKNPMYANIVRNLVMCAMVVVGLNKLPLFWFGVCGSIGEGLAMIVSAELLCREHHLKRSSTLFYPWLSLLCISICGIISAVMAIHGTPFQQIVTLSFGMLTAGLLFFILPNWRKAFDS